MPKQVTIEQSLQLVKKVAVKHEKEAKLIISQEWFKDSNAFVYKDKGDLQDSGQLYSDFKAGILKWRTVYARLRYYLGGKAGDGNRNAKPRWAEVAKARNLRKYNAIAIKLLKKIKKEVYR